MEAAAAQPQADAPSSASRRIYLGNLPYTVKPYDVEEMLAANGFEQVDKIHISVDPVSARNPGYCFVEFADCETAERALAELSATIGGRSVKVGPCEPKKRDGRDGRDDSFAFQRWGDWRVKAADGAAAADGRRARQGPHGALDHFADMVHNFEGRRLFVGGLGKMTDQAQNSRQIREIFDGFHPTAIGKRITPHESKRSDPGNHHYCFVDFETRDEASAAIKALDGKHVEGGWLKVAPARGIPDKLMQRHPEARQGGAGAGAGNNGAGSGSGNGNGASSWRPRSGPPPASKAMASADWRRAGDG